MYMKVLKVLFASVVLIIIAALFKVYFAVDAKVEHPGEWMYNQRAYPYGEINSNSIKQAYIQHSKAKEKATKSSVLWELLGPKNTGGRITDVAISSSDNNILYVSTPVGGVFKSTDGGLSWVSIFEDIGKPSVGCIELAPSNNNTIYLGTGDPVASATSGAFIGDGMYKSTDAGDTWSPIGLENTEHIARICVDPIDENKLFVAATGTLYGKNNERGVYRSLDGGATWEQVLFVSDSTAIIDLIVNPNNTDTIFAAAWERIRYPWARSYAGVTSGVYRSVDGGDSWNLLQQGLPVPSEDMGRIGLAMSTSNPNYVYASFTTDPVTNVFDALYKSTNGGDSWYLYEDDSLSDVNASFGWFFGNVRVSPNNPDDVWVLGKYLFRKRGAQYSWENIEGMHVDHHVLEFSHTDENFIVCGNDGGLYTSEDGGFNWSHIDNLPITQFYHIEVDEQNPDRVYGGTQDNNTIRTLTGNDDDWMRILGGDGFHVIVDPFNSNRILAEYQWGNLYYSESDALFFEEYMMGIDEEDRTNWNTPVVISPSDNTTIYYGSHRLYTTTFGESPWLAISGDLTGGDLPEGALSYATITTIAPSYNSTDVIYVGSDDGRVHVTFDGGNSWIDISDGIPNRYITKIIVHPNNDSIAYVSLSGYRYLDYEPHVLKTENGGQTWIDVSAELPEMPVNDLVFSKSNLNIYLANDAGVWYSNDEGDSWSLLGENLPFTICTNLEIHDQTKQLFVGTFGRSSYVLDISSHYLELDEFSAENLNIYPNPTSNKIKLSLNSGVCEHAEVKIYDVNGKLIQDFYSEYISESGLEIDLSTCPRGVLLITVKTDIGVFSEKVLLID